MRCAAPRNRVEGSVIPDVERILESLGPARKFADPDSPESVRAMAARGALPLPPPQIVTVLFVLTRDPDEAIRERATTSLAELPERILTPALQAELDVALLDHLAKSNRERPELLEKIALNPATADLTFCFLAGLPLARLVDITASNQIRLMRCDQLVEVLSENPVTSPATLDRVLEFLGIPVPDRTPTDPVPESPPPKEGTALEESAPIDPDSVDGLPEDALRDFADESPEETEKRTQSLFGQIQSMGVMQKIKLARFGNAEARSILIRDRNKLIASAAIRSPKLGDAEVLTFAKSRSVSDETLRVIGSSREWCKSKAIKVALVMNPKTPVAISMKFLGHMTDGELSNVMKSKDVAGPIAAQARRMLIKKGKV
jgi:hypothetical protein